MFSLSGSSSSVGLPATVLAHTILVKADAGKCIRQYAQRAALSFVHVDTLQTRTGAGSVVGRLADPSMGSSSHAAIRFDLILESSREAKRQDPLP